MWQETPGYHAAGAFSAGQVLEAAVQKVGSFDREKLRDAFDVMVVQTVRGPYKVDAAGRQIGKPNYTIQWQNGRRVVVWPQEFALDEVRPFAWR